jgi:uncharacterized protein (TIGR03118 family)
MTRYHRLITAGALCALAFAAHAEKNRYQLQPLVSDVPGAAARTDPHLVNGWGIAFNPNAFVWVSDNGTGLSTLYDGFGNPQSLVVTIPAAPGNTEHGKPTGIVFSGSSDFAVTSGGKTGPARFLFATEDGLIAGWSPAVLPTQAVQAYPPIGAPASPAVYKGPALANTGSANFLYATDFVGGKIDVFDATFTKVTMPGGFVDPNLPKGYSPFNIQNVGGHLFVTYAKREDDEDDETAGPGLGAVDEFDTAGHLLRRIATHGKLNAPWGIALAPASFGKFAGDLLIGNFGDGTINAYDLRSGNFRGQLKGVDHRVLKIDGLWGMAFGNDRSDQPSGTLFAAAGPDHENHGSYNAITPAPGMQGEDDDDDD